MKKLFTFVFFLFFYVGFSQIYKYPMASPRQVISQQFSVTKISVDYGRPSVRGRKIFGELVPFGKIWRVGANEATNITFEQGVLFGGKSTKPGRYAIFITPEEKQWNVALNYDADAWGAYSYDPNENAIEIKVPVQEQKELQESLEISFEGISDTKINLVIRWEYSKVEIPIEVDKAEQINKIIEHLREIKQIERDMGE
ncbi:DUF2911 domain-containing protein [Capnocytophaga sp.]|uniref:DUF2911 domain-containing protein n=1 Tax=Capnocytophaga sp. TaxID=44737 RepID=UPI0026DC88C8|nr:DUF2911 domain-containing protein [Capnocytophaga sp.]MDO5105086.1 DUF2911 domain-containing protein [Capnocytophaga sp.]